MSQTNSKAEGLVWVSACIHAHTNKGMFRGTEVGPPLGVHGGDVEGDSLEPEHHEQSLGEGAVPNLGPITASLKSNPIPALGPVHGPLPRPCSTYITAFHTLLYSPSYSHSRPIFPFGPRSNLGRINGYIFSRGRLMASQ